MLTASEKLEALTNLSIQLNEVADLDLLMERILIEARRFVGADAGSIYIREDDKLNFSYTQNKTFQDRLPPGAKLIWSAFSVPIDEDSIAGFAASTGKMLNIPDVYKLDGSVSYRFGRKFDEKSGYRTQSMLTAPLINNRGDILGVLQTINSQGEDGRITIFNNEDEKMMTTFAGIATVALERARMTRAIILRMISMAELHDPKETGAHVNRVGAYAVELYEAWAKRQGLSRDEIDAKRDVLRMAAMLHDVGKVAISDLILKKPSRFTEDEFEVMKQHARLGAVLFKDKHSEFDDAAGEVALNHHERWDGKGYPGYIDIDTGEPLPGYEIDGGKAKGKVENEIPLFGRITSIADVFDALCSRRVYKEAWEESDTLKVLEEEAGRQFDPELIEIFFDNLDIIRSIRQRYPDKGESA